MNKMNKLELCDFFVTNNLTRTEISNSGIKIECPPGFLDRQYEQCFKSQLDQERFFNIPHILDKLYKDFLKTRVMSLNEYHLFAIYTFEFLSIFSKLVDSLDSNHNRLLVIKLINNLGKNIFKHSKPRYVIYDEKIISKMPNLFDFLRDIRDFHVHFCIGNKKSIFNMQGITFFWYDCNFKISDNVENSEKFFFYSATTNRSKIIFKINQMFWIKIYEEILLYLSKFPQFKKFITVI